tara:strand:- start:459 stop:2504 length:2046 start_codon:yes stop_codon:yes gene_type:complete
MAVPKQFKNYRDGFLAQGDPVGMTGRDFVLTGPLTQTVPMHIDVRGISLARLHGIESKKTSVLSGNGAATSDAAAGFSNITVDNGSPHGLKLNQLVSVSGTTGFTTAGMDALVNGAYRITAITANTFTFLCSGDVTGGAGTAGWEAVVAAKDATHDTGVVSVTVEEGHGLTSGQQVLIVDASAWDVNAYATSNVIPGTPGDYTRSVQVTAVSPTVFSYEVHAARDPGNDGKISYQCDPLYTQFKLFSGIQDNQRISLINANASSFSLDVSNIEILDKWIPQQNDTLELYWSALKKKWVGLADQLREDTDFRSTTMILQSEDLGIMMADAADYITLIEAPGEGKYIKVHEARLSKKAVPKQFSERTCFNVIKSDPAVVVGSVVAAVGTTMTVTSVGHGLTNGTVISVTATNGFTNPAEDAKVDGTWTVVNAATNSFDFVVANAPLGGPGTLSYQSRRGTLEIPTTYLGPRLTIGDRIVLTGIGTGLTPPSLLTSPLGVLGASLAITGTTAAKIEVEINGILTVSGVPLNDSVVVSVINGTDEGTFYYMFHDQGDGAGGTGLNTMLPNNQVRDGFVESISDSKMILVPQTDILQGENIEVQNFGFAGGGDGDRRTDGVAGTSVDLENKSYVMNLLTAATGLPAGGAFYPQQGGGIDNHAAVPQWTVTLRYEIVDISAIGELKS